MKRMKKLNQLFIVGIIVLIISACNTSEAQSDQDKSDTNGNDSNWAEENGINLTESVDELYEKAKEEGKVVIYAKSSRFKDVKTSFEAEYPGITVEPYKISRPEIREKLVREHGSGVYNADVIFTSVEQDLIDDGYFHIYSPEDIVDNYVDAYKDPSTYANIIDIKPVFYNTDAYDGPPIDNWWEMTEPEWSGKVMLNDPITDVSLSETFLAIIQNSDEMEAAYKDKYGEDIELTEENAGYEFIARLLENDPVLISSGEDIVESIGQMGQATPHIGIAPSSKLRHIEQSGIPLAAVFDLKPRISAIGTSSLYIADQSPHPNAAKLLIRWVMGEADGKSKGLEPFNMLGSWIPRTDIDNPNPISVEEISAWEVDQEFYNKNFTNFRNFWISHID